MILDRPVLIELIRLTLNHGVYTTRAVTTAADAANVLSAWQPHLGMLGKTVELDEPEERVEAVLRRSHSADERKIRQPPTR